VELLSVRNLSKSYPDGWRLSDISFDLALGEILCLLGPSGCGKTTLLRLIAGLEQPDQGRILIEGQDVAGTPPHLRGFGMMFQEYALFPHMDVFGNVAFGLRAAGLSQREIQERVAQALEMVNLVGFDKRDVSHLSGGEKQRVALARSLAPQPRLLMLDEPVGALDRELRDRLLTELPAILDRAGVTAISVTHDQEEAFALADRLIVMREGRVVQQGTPRQVYLRPASAWVARFLGLNNLVPARTVEGGQVSTALGLLQVASEETCDPGMEVILLIHSEACSPASSGINRLEGIVQGHVFRGSHYQMSLEFAGGTELTFEWPSTNALPAVGERLSLCLDPRGLTVLCE
jgi:ABC-type Fe3+/spermidine/putrescine transport system ATPase subunit